MPWEYCCNAGGVGGLYVAVDDNGASIPRIVRLDDQSFDPIWEIESPLRDFSGNPFGRTQVFTDESGDAFVWWGPSVSSTGANVYRYSSGGSVMWSRTYNGASPLLSSDGFWFVTNSNQTLLKASKTNGALTVNKTHADLDIEIYAADATGGIYGQTFPKVLPGNPVIRSLTRFDASGDIDWTSTPAANTSEQWSNINVTGGQEVVARFWDFPVSTYEYYVEVYSLTGTRTQNLRHSTPLDSRLFVGPADQFYIANLDHLLDTPLSDTSGLKEYKTDGTNNWQIPFQGDGHTSGNDWRLPGNIFWRSGTFGHATRRDPGTGLLTQVDGRSYSQGLLGLFMVAAPPGHFGVSG